ncbi:hypothetical protein JCM6882_006729 [Rhodosporidiobolus microsporus]
MEALMAHLAAGGNCSYRLEVVQQPVRARMCGFGDKDRRPISPPLIVKLTARDATTGEEIQVDDIDTTFLILAADLRTGDAQYDANLIAPPTSSAADSHSRSTTRTASPKSASSQHSPSRDSSPASPPYEYPSPADSHYGGGLGTGTTTPSVFSPPKPLASLPEEEDVRSNGLTHPASPEDEEDRKPVLPPASPTRPLEPPLSLSFPGPSSSPRVSTGPSPAKRQRLDPSSLPLPLQPLPPPTATTQNANFIPYARERRSPVILSATSASSLSSSSAAAPSCSAAPPMYGLDPSDPPPVPNLIGTLHTNAYKLKDLEGQGGVYFVLPDLSVRTEGSFRLRLRLLSIGLTGSQVNTGTAVVATEHSDEFRVFSAKKFEGMLDPTPLSQCFAKQGVRIPTRKVAKTRAAPAQGKAAAMAAAAKEAAGEGER